MTNINLRCPSKPASALRSTGDDVRRLRFDGAKIPKLYTIEQIAEYVDVSTRTVRRWIEKGLLVAHRVGGLIRISDVDFQAFLATHRDI